MSKLEVKSSAQLAITLLSKSNTGDEKIDQVHLESEDIIKVAYENVDTPETINISNAPIEFEIKSVVIKDFEASSEISTKTVPTCCCSKLWNFYIAYRGILFAIACCFCTSLTGFVVKYLSLKNYSASVCLLWRCPGLLFFSVSEMLYKLLCQKAPIFDTIWPWTENDRRKTFLILILSRVILGPLSMLAQFYAFTFMDLGDAQTIIYSNSVFVTLFAHFILHESWGVVPVVASLITIFGVMIISKPPFITGEQPTDNNRGYGIALAVTAMLLNTFVYITMRFLCNVHSSITMLAMALASIVLALGIGIARNESELPKEVAHVPAFVGLIVFTLLGGLTFTLALQYEEAGIVSLTRSLDVVLSFMWQMILDVYPDAYSLGGASLVLSCITVIFFRKFLRSLPADHALVKYLWFLMK